MMVLRYGGRRRIAKSFYVGINLSLSKTYFHDLHSYQPSTFEVFFDVNEKRKLQTNRNVFKLDI